MVRGEWGEGEMGGVIGKGKRRGRRGRGRGGGKGGGIGGETWQLQGGGRESCQRL